MIYSAQFPPEVQQALRSADGAQRQRIMAAIARENRRQNDRMRLGGLSRRDSEQGFINAVRSVSGGGNYGGISRYSSRLDFSFNSRSGERGEDVNARSQTRISGRKFSGGPAQAGHIVQSMINSAGYSL